MLHAGLMFAEVDKVLSAYGQPNDPDLPQQWAMYKLGLFSQSYAVNGLQNVGAWNRYCWNALATSVKLCPAVQGQEHGQQSAVRHGRLLALLPCHTALVGPSCDPAVASLDCLMASGDGFMPSPFSNIKNA